MDLTEVNAVNSQRHPWELARAAFFADILTLYTKGAGRYLDVGSGDAWFAHEFWKNHRQAQFTCWDSGYGDNQKEQLLSAAKDTGAFSFTATRPDAVFDAVLLMDVLEHVEHDEAFLGDTVTRNVKKQGYVLVSVPAWPALFSEHDRRLRHYRRYAPAQIRQVLASAGLRILDSGGLFSSLLMARGIQKIIQTLSFNRWSPDSTGEWTHGPLISQCVERVLRADSRFARAVHTRLGVQLHGLSWWALCQK